MRHNQRARYTTGTPRRWQVCVSVVLASSMLMLASPAAAEHTVGSGPRDAAVVEPEPPDQPAVPPEALEGMPAGAVLRDAGPDFREWANADGTVTREFFTGPVFFEQGPDVWVPIDLSLVKAGQSDQYLQRRAPEAAAVFAGASAPGATMVRLGGNGPSGVRYPDAVLSSVVPVVSDRSITYPKALLGGRDLTLTATTAGFEETVVVPNASAPGTYRTEFTVPAGVTARQAGPGVEFLSLGGEVIARFGGGLAWDSASQRSETPVLVDLKTATPTNVITETRVAASWLDAAERVYPITIDPTYTGPTNDTCPTSFSTFNGCDTYTNSDNLDGNSGTGYWQNSELRMGSSGAMQEGSTTTLSDTRAFVKFATDQFGTYPYQHTVEGATLDMYAYDAGGNTSSRQYNAYLSSSNPSRNTVWNNQPPRHTSPWTSQWLSGTGTITFEVYQLANEWFTGAKTNHGFYLRADATRDTTSFRQFRSWNSGFSTAPRLTVTYAANPPLQPQSVNASAGDGYADVSWSTPAYDGAATITAYEVDTFVNGSYWSTAVLSSSARSHRQTGLPNGSAVDFDVYAKNSRGYSPPAASPIVTPRGRPDAPGSVSASAGNATASVSWSAPNDRGSAISAYIVKLYRASDGVELRTATLSSLARSHAESGLVNGQSVYFKVIARNGIGDSNPAQSPTVTPLAPPGAPQNVNAVPGNALASVTWGAPSVNGGTPVTGYVVEVRRGDNSLHSSESLAPSARSYEKTGLDNGAAYYFRIFANNSVGQSPPAASNVVTPMAPPDERPDIPTLLTPAVAYTFPTEELPQRFSLVTHDRQGDRYQAEVELVADNGAPVHSSIAMPPADSDQIAEGQTSLPLLEGRYRWRARACDIATPVHCSDWGNWRAFQVGAPLRASSGSNTVGLEHFYAYERWQTGAGTAFLNTANGNLVVQETDVAVPGPINLRLTRTYNTIRDGETGPLGRGWTLGIAEGEGMADALLEAVLSLDVDRMVRIVGNEDMFEIFDADGTTHHFARGGLAGPGWHSPPGVNLTLTDGPDGVNRWYHATRPDGLRYEFKMIGGAYRLDRIADREGNVLSLSYTGGKLTQISDGNGRVLTFTWAGEFLSQARYSAQGDSHDVAYTVDAGTGRLTGVTHAAGTTDARSRGFAYNDEGLSSVTDGRGNSTAFTVSGKRLTALTDRAGKTWQVRYDTACDPPAVASLSSVCVLAPVPIGVAQPQRTWTVQATTGNPVAFTDEGDADEAGNARRNRRTFMWSANQLARSTDEAGNATEYSYNRLGQIERQVFTGAGEQPVVTQMEYAEHSTIAGVADMTRVRAGVGSVGERSWQFGYDSAHKGLLTTARDPLGHTTTFGYYGNGLLKTVTDPRGHTTSYGDTASVDGAYHLTGQPTKVTDPTGAFMTMAYDFMGRMTQRVDRTAQTWSQVWDRRGNLRSATSPLGTVTTWCYDANDNQVAQIQPKAASHSCGQAATTPYVTSVIYDTRDQMTATESTSDGQRRKTAYVYADDGQLDAMLLPRSFDPATGADVPAALAQKVVYERYPNDRLKGFIDPEGNRTDLVHTPNGLLRRVTEPPGGSATSAPRRTVTTAYNGRGQQTQVAVSGQGGSTRHEYDRFGNRTATVTPKGQRTEFAYNANGWLIATTDAERKLTDRAYDAAGNLTRITLPTDIAGALVNRFAYNARNEIASEIDPSDPDHTVAYTYDGEGRQLLRTDLNSGLATRTVQQTWRSDGLLAERASFLPSTTTGMHKATFDYDDNGNPTSVRTYLDGAAMPNVSDISIGHTSANEPKTWTETLYPPTGPGVTKVSAFTYERDGALSSRTVDGLASTYEHLRNGLESTTTSWGGTGVVTSTWNPNSTLAAQALPNGAAATYAYDPAARVSSKVVAKAGVALSSWQQVVYDPDGNRTGEVVSQLQPAGTMKTGTANYSYDLLDRLIKAKHPFETETKDYTLDEGGNILADGDSTFTYAKNRLTKTQPATEPDDWPAGLGPFPFAEFRTTFAYDLHGNIVQSKMPAQANSTTTFAYDAAMHPRRTTTPDGKWVEYAYDAFDRLVRRHNSDGEIRLMYMDRSIDQVALETDQNGVAQTRYVLDSRGAPVGQEQVGSAGISWYVTDLRNNLTQLLDSTGAVKAVYGYDPFGQTKSALTNTTGGFDSKLRYQMAPVDTATGTYNLGPRLYDPSINRFVGADSYVGAAANMSLALDPLTGNRYLYAGANPAGLVDDGHSPAPACRAMARATIIEYLTGVACPPSDFAQYLGYTPELISLPWGNRFVRQNGSCSSPTLWVTWHYGFTTACLTHDYGYDLIRYFRATGRTVDGGTRASVDRLFRRDLRSTCSNRFNGWRQIQSRVNCYGWSEAYYRAVRTFGGFVFDEPLLKRRE